MKGQRRVEVVRDSVADEESRAIQMRDQRDALFAIVSHELRNSLGSVSIRADLLDRGLPEGEFWQPLRKHIQVIEAAARNMTHALDGLADVSAIETGTLELAANRHDLGPILDSVRDELVRAASAKGVRIITDRPQHPLVARCDQERVHRVLYTLAQRAVADTPQGGVVALRLRTTYDVVQVTVHNTGPALSGDDLALLRSGSDRAPISGGSARLELFVAKGVVEAHGGRLWAEPTEHGKALSFTLPFATSQFIRKCDVASSL
jgi:signal transduction histidine kinase